MSQYVHIDMQHVLCLRNQLALVELGPHFDMNVLVRWHEATWAHCEHIPSWNGERPSSFHFYTDGSATEHDSVPQAAAAVFLVVETCHGPRLAGFRSALITDNANAPFAEHAAIYLALLWLIGIDNVQPGIIAGTTIHFGFDSQVAGQTAAGQWQMKRSVDVARMNRALVHWISQRFACGFEWTHIKSHTGHPMNEAADAVAWATVCGWISTIDFEDVLAFTTFEGRFVHEFDWLWFIERVLANSPDCPRLIGTALRVDVSAPFEVPPSSQAHDFVEHCRESVRGHCGTSEPPPTTIDIKFMTANILSLSPGGGAHGHFTSARQESLAALFAANGATFVGLQETRSRQSGHTTLGHYHVLSSPAVDGQAGVQLWVAKSIADGRYCITPRDLRVLMATPRALLVALKTRWIRLHLLVLHAPSATSDINVDEWWLQLSGQLEGIVHRAPLPLVVMADANARVGSETSIAISDFDAEQENESGAAWHRFLLDFHLWLPQTWSDAHVGPSATWRHSTGSSARLDYIAVDRALGNGGLRTTIADVDIAIKRDDHYPVELCISLPLVAPPQPPVASEPSPSTPGALTTSWSQDVHSHAAALQHWVKAFQPPRPAYPRKRHMAWTTWEMVRTKNYHYKQCRRLQLLSRKDRCREFLHRWSGCRRTQHTFVKAALPRCLQRLCATTLAWHQWRVDCLRPLVQAALRQDDSNYYEELAARQGDVAADEGMPGLWRVIRGLLPRQHRKRASRATCVGPPPEDLARHFCPPCETWSAARHLVCPDRPAAPRPLRSRERAWGLVQLTLAELRQLSTGSALLCRSLILELLVVLMGGGCLMEHPAPPLDASHVSTWTTEIQTNYMHKLPFARTCNFSQYRFGAVSVKPTTFRVAGLPGFAPIFYGEQENYERPTTQLGGWSLFEGRYRTAAAKEYPPKLCRAMVWSVLTVARRRFLREGARSVAWSTIPERDRAWLDRLEADAQSLTDEFRPDYQPRGEAM
eukprot:Skav226880  [mRNA]  locus=scaffold1187:311960:318342:- [translate_table: standard]